MLNIVKELLVSLRNKPVIVEFILGIYQPFLLLPAVYFLLFTRRLPVHHLAPWIPPFAQYGIIRTRQSFIVKVE